MDFTCSFSLHNHKVTVKILSSSGSLNIFYFCCLHLKTDCPCFNFKNCWKKKLWNSWYLIRVIQSPNSKQKLYHQKQTYLLPFGESIWQHVTGNKNRNMEVRNHTKMFKHEWILQTCIRWDFWTLKLIMLQLLNCSFLVPEWRSWSEWPSHRLFCRLFHSWNSIQLKSCWVGRGSFTEIWLDIKPQYIKSNLFDQISLRQSETRLFYEWRQTVFNLANQSRSEGLHWHTWFAFDVSTYADYFRNCSEIYKHSGWVWFRKLWHQYTDMIQTYDTSIETWALHVFFGLQWLQLTNTHN